MRYTGGQKGTLQAATLIQKLEHFIKKYYQNQLIKGAIIALSLVLIAFFSLSFVEYFGRFSSTTRTALFYLFITVSVGTLVWYIVRPILGLVNISRKFGVKEASVLIGNHFPEVQDKLLNTLQLQEDAKLKNSKLLLASIEQRTSELGKVPFISAIPFQKNIEYIKYGLLPAVILGLVLIVSPGFKKSSQRIVNFGKHFEIEAPFTFSSEIEKQQAIQNQDVLIPLEISGDKIPQDAYIHIGKQRYKMKANGIGNFSYNLSNIQKSQSLYFEAGGFSSKEYDLNIALKPSLVGYSATIRYPKYWG
ncbi:ATPase, partial [Bacteroidia bacterium]|nr:ATPase [Bacteroidia bacterium]